MFKGSIAAVVTPFHNGEPGKEDFLRHVEWLIGCGTHGIVPCGSTGESATLTHREHSAVIEWAVKAAGGRAKVIAGTGSNSTSEAIELTKAARDLGADAVLLIAPYYNKPTQEGLYRHYMTIADEVDIPQILYNVPGRTAVNILPETVASLSSHPNIVGIKEASGSVEQALTVIEMCGKDFLLLSGDDALNFPLLAIGGHGSISVTANIWPEKMARMHDCYFSGDMETARTLHFEMLELHRTMFIETNPVPVKTALAMMGRVKEEFRLPLVEISAGNRKRLEAVLRKYSLIS